MPLLATKNLTKSFGGVRAVDRVNTTFEGGKITALIGPNGSGKTTLINAVTGIFPQDAGSVVISNSVELTRIAPHDIARYGMTRTFQSVRLVEQISVLDNILLALTERSVWGALAQRYQTLHEDTASDILKKVGLWEKRNEQAGKLSYGQRKLLEIGRAIAMNAKIYFFDEPFAGLFPEMRTIVSNILRELKQSDAAVVLVEHDMGLVRSLADYCYVLDSGKVIAEGTPAEVLERESVIEAYLGK